MHLINKEILLTIGVPTYNRVKLLERNLKSYIEEADESVEILVSDDSTNEDSRVLVENMNKKYDGKISYVKNQQPKNVAKESKQAINVNNIINKAAGKFVYILHDDDFLMPGGLVQIIFSLQQNASTTSIFMFGVNLVDLQGRVTKPQTEKKEKHYSSPEALKKLLTNSSFVRTPSMIIKKEAYEKVGLYDPGRKIPLDFDMWSRLFCDYELLRLPFITSAYTIHGNTQTMQMFNEENINIQMDIFDKVEKRNIISKGDLNSHKSLFFHQWILAGTYRNLKRGRLKEAKAIMGLFKMEDVKVLKTPAKWFALKVLFRLATIFA